MCDHPDLQILNSLLWQLKKAGASRRPLREIATAEILPNNQKMPMMPCNDLTKITMRTGRVQAQKTKTTLAQMKTMPGSGAINKGILTKKHADNSKRIGNSEI